MNLKKLTLGIAASAAIAAPMAATPASADVFFPMLTYRTGPFAPNGTPIAKSSRPLRSKSPAASDCPNRSFDSAMPLTPDVFWCQ